MSFQPPDADTMAAWAVADLLAPYGWRDECYRRWEYDDDDGNELAVWVEGGTVYAAETSADTGEVAVFGLSSNSGTIRAVASLSAWLAL
jgi:hypothetical protein